tara:strand:+ start:11501 stop:11692 length:192 start_codon:yes stop_codon:yes gene_type:complete
MDGLKMIEGRLVNDRPVGVTGIAQAAQMRKQNMQRSLSQDIAMGIELAQKRDEFKKIMPKIFK